MESGLSAAEMNLAVEALRSEAIGGAAIAALDRHDGDLEAAFDAVLVAQFGPPADFSGPPLRETVLQQLRKELCADEGFRAKVKEYMGQPTKATVLVSAVTFLLESVALPFVLSPAVASLVVLWILKFGLEVFCAHTEDRKTSDS